MNSSGQLPTINSSPCCPVTGLPIISKPEWTDIKLDSEYSVTFSIVGRAILLITPKGYPTDEGAKLLLEKREEIISEAGIADKKYVELRDYRMLTAVPSKGGRMIITNFLLKEQSKGHLQGFWMFGAPLLIRFMMQAGLKLHKASIPVGSVKDYPEAIRNAVQVLRQNRIDVGSKLYPRLKKDEWALEIEGYGISFERIGDDILYTSAHGKLKESNIEQFIGLHKKVLDEAGLTQKGYYYRIVNWERFASSTWKARRMYMEWLNEINKSTPCKLLVIFGLNKFMKTLVGISRPFVSSPVIVANDLQDALEIIERERQRETKAEPAEKIQKHLAKTYTDAQLNEYANEMLQVIGGINWDQTGILLGNMSEKHPLKPVLDALSIIKLDLDNMLLEKEISKKALHDSEVMYRFLADNASDTIWMMSLEGVFTYHSPAVMKLRGYTPEEANNVGMEQTVTPASLSLLLSMVEEENAKPPTERWADRVLEMEMYRKDGSIIWTEASVRGIRDSKGNVTALQGSTRDITGRRKAEEKLRESEEKYRWVISNMADVITVTGMDLRFTYVSPSILRMRGYTAEEATAQTFEQAMTPESLQMAVKVFEEEMNLETTGSAEPGRSRILELEQYRKDGSTVWMENSLSFMRDETQKPVGIISVSRDITDRKQAESKLLESEEKYRNILQNIEDGYFEVDLTGNFTFFNASMCRILGYPAEEMSGMNNRSYMSPENAKKVLQSFHEIYLTGIPKRGFEWEIIQKNGTRKHLEVSVSLMLNREGKQTGFCGIGRDVTEKKLIEATNQARMRAETANKAKSQFLANMSHEIRTPLNGIMGMAEALLDTVLDGNQKHIISTMTKEANSLLGIINEVLDFSKIEAGKLKIERIPFDLRSLFEDVTESFSHRMTQKGLELISCISPATPTLLVGDPGRLRQILRNLIGNALKFTHEGRIIVMAETVHDLEDCIRLRFLVADTGIGIPQEKQALVFESFTQADGSTTRKYGGTGLGISISKQLAELMGGEIGLESDEGKGSTFWFTAVFSKQRETDFQKRRDVPLNNVRILVVDNSKTSRQTTVEYINSWGADPVEAESAKKALSILKGSITGEQQITLVLIDLDLQKINGFDLAREIRRLESFRSIPIIMVTSFGNPGDGKTCRDIGIAGYLTKPINERGLRGTIESVLCPKVSVESGSEIDLVTRHTKIEMDRKDIRILLAEDYPTNQEIAKIHLAHAGYQVDLAENGKLALDAFRLKHYDLILMDIQMPVMDGYQATRAIREIEAKLAAMENTDATKMLHRVPIVAMTAHALSEHKDLCLEAGMDDFLSKPLTRKDLLAIVAKWLKVKSKSATINQVADTGQDVAPQAILSGLPIDLERAINEFEGDRKLVAEVIAGFIKKVSEQLVTIREALSCGDAETVRREAHSIKGGAAGLTAGDLAKVAFELENKGKSKDLSGADKIVHALETKFEALRLFIQENFSQDGVLEGPYFPEEFLDREALLRSVGGKENLVNELIDYFVKDMPLQIQAISRALTSGDFVLLGRHAHRLKGAAATMCAKQVAAIASQIQLAAKEENLLKADSLVKELQEHFNCFITKGDCSEPC